MGHVGGLASFGVDFREAILADQISFVGSEAFPIFKRLGSAALAARQLEAAHDQRNRQLFAE
jgi:hypothetical protein